VHVVRLQMPFFDSTFFMLRQSAKHISQMLSQLPVQYLLPKFRYEHYVVLAVPLRVI
jgi:hypothetical protein